ncbi:deoxyribose-phosphate aldolase [Gordonia sp. FQ]|uniref:deoxyribose-phosphate aldolase n=1 Tax=Gordonia sp. FQ TaxID=3446634 RepID=UPI003F86AB62
MVSTTMYGREIAETLQPGDIARMIDHSLLRPDLTREEVEAGCRLAAELGTASVCVRPCDVVLARQVLNGTAVAVGTVVAFPHGNATTAAKRFEAEQALRDGAVEIDMVVDIGALIGGDDRYVLDEIRTVVEPAHAAGALVKVILENAYLDDEQIRRGSRLTESAGADFVKTSTGFAPGGATVHDLRIMADSTGPDIQVKAAGGVRTLDRLLALTALGVTRFGATATAMIMAEAEERAGGRGGGIRVPSAPESESDVSGGAAGY